MNKYLIDPVNITNFNLNQKQLELVLLFWVCAAGKNALTAAKSLNNFLYAAEKFGGNSPFAHIRKVGAARLPKLMKKHGIGCYNSKAKTFNELAYSGLDLRYCSVDDLEAVHGIGFKTSRCFLIHSRKNANVAGLDVHILKYLADLGYEVPRQTPSSRRQYLELEQIFLDRARQTGKSIAEFDLEVWREYSGNA